MLIPKYWRKIERETQVDGLPFWIRAWGHSMRSAEEALAMAGKRFDKIAATLSGHGPAEEYGYLAHPMREVRLEIFGGEADPAAAITRNGYGSLVLNTKSAMFVDVDVPPPGCLALFVKIQQKRETEAIQRIEAVVAERAGLGFRLYKTLMGFRLIATDKLHDPAARETIELMRQLGSDPLYVKLCEKQECFRARISPKPWRIGQGKPPVRYPDEETQTVYDAWCAECDRAAKSYATCRFVQHIGTALANSEIDAIVQLHDTYCQVASEKELR